MTNLISEALGVPFELTTEQGPRVDKEQYDKVLDSM